jgi:hypothetical protein
MGFNAVLRDYARIGLMMLNNGQANGRRLLSSEWVAQSTIPTGTEPAAPGSTRGYQYQWWTLTDSDAYFALGLQGQYIYVDPPTRTVAVKLSYFPPGEQRAGAETEAFLRAASQWTPGPAAAARNGAESRREVEGAHPRVTGSEAHIDDLLRPNVEWRAAMARRSERLYSFNFNVRLLASPAPGGSGRRCRQTAGKPDNRLGIGLGQGVAAAAAGGRRWGRDLTAARGCPAIARRPVLHHARSGAGSVAVQVLSAGIAVELSVLQGRVVHLDDGILIARVVLRPT